MKRLQQFAPFLIFSLCLVACSSDDGPSDGVNQELLDELVGTYNLIAFEVSPAQDLNDDGITSSDLLMETDCITGSFTLTASLDWSMTFANPSITPITGDDFAIICTSQTNTTGRWSFQNNELTLNGAETKRYLRDGTTFVSNSGLDLPEIRRVIFQKR